MFIHDDVRTLTARLVRERLGYLPSVIVGSPPCQGASLANTGRTGLDDPRTGLALEFLRLVDECRPVFFVAENVPGFRTAIDDPFARRPFKLGPSGRVAAFERFALLAQMAGYAVQSLVVGAADAGAPHQRKRAWMVGIRRDAADAVQACGRTRQPAGRRGGGQGNDGWPQFAGWHSWNGGPPAAGRVDDGLPTKLARQWLGAYGDAVVPQVTEAIGRVMADLCPTDGTVMDLFSGAAGGWSLGMSRAGYRAGVMCEADPWRRSVLEQRYGASA